MTKTEMEYRIAEQQKIIDAQRDRVKRQNERAKTAWDTVSCRLPKGTKDRIVSKGLTVNGFINELVLEELERLENMQN